MYIFYTVKQSLCSDSLFNSTELTLLLFHGGGRGRGLKEKKQAACFLRFRGSIPSPGLIQTVFLIQPLFNLILFLAESPQRSLEESPDGHS